MKARTVSPNFPDRNYASNDTSLPDTNQRSLTLSGTFGGFVRTRGALAAVASAPENRSLVDESCDCLYLAASLCRRGQREEGKNGRNHLAGGQL